MNYSLSNIFTFFLVLTGFFTLTFINYNLDFIFFDTKFYILFSYAICACVIIDYIFKIKSFKYIPILPLTCLYYISCYLSAALFKFNIFKNHGTVNTSDLSFAIFVLTLGIFFLIAGYYIFKIIFKNTERKEIKLLNFSLIEMFYFGLILNLSTVLFFYIFQIQNFLSFTAQIKYVFLFLSFGAFTNYLFHSNKFYEKKNLLIIIFKITIILYELLRGSYALPFILIFLDYVYYSFLKKKFNLIPVIIFFFIFLFIHEGKYQFRNLTWNVYNYERNHNIFDSSKIFLKIYKHNLKSNFDIKNFFDVNNKTYRRVSHSFESLVIVTSKSPNEIDFWNGYSYRILASKLIPRVFWKDKPSDILGNEFGHRYKILNNNDRYTSWNMPVLNEFYVNFGTRGVIVGMFIIGLFFSFLAKFFSIKDTKNAEGFIAFYLFVPLFYLESHLSLLIGAILQSYILSIFISIFFIVIFRKLKLNLYLK